MGSHGGKQTVTQGFDPGSQAYIDEMRGAANGAAGAGAAGVNPLTTQAGQYYQNMAAGGNLGFGALTGNQADLAHFQNPYTNNVVNASMNDFSHMRDLTMQGINSQATQAGAFGGDRASIAQGQALGDLGRGEQSQLAGLRQQGFEDSMGRAGMAANMGFGAAGQMQGLGDYMRNIQQLQSNPDLWRLQVMQGGLGPVGSTTTQTGTTGKNGFTGFLGGAGTGAAAGASIGGPWGAGIGAGLGGLMGVFGS